MKNYQLWSNSISELRRPNPSGSESAVERYPAHLRQYWLDKLLNEAAAETFFAPGAVEIFAEYRDDPREWGRILTIAKSLGIDVRQFKRAVDAYRAGLEESVEEPLSVAWPRMDAAALHGLPGDVVRYLDPYTEADPVAVLGQVLAYFGNCVGPQPYYMVEGSRHPMLLNLVLVGKTAKARKGSSASRVRSLFKHADPIWEEHHLRTGLSSGEGLIHDVRNDAETGALLVASGIDLAEDKRRLITETEFAQTLSQLMRPGNTLGPVLRNAWDGEPLQTMTKHSAMRSTGHHISVIGHITLEELQRKLSDTEMFNGFGNRFLWLCVTRSKELPDGGTLEDATLHTLAERIKVAVQFARTVQTMERDDEARAMWRGVYSELSAGKPGVFGALTARAEAQALRLSCIYALMDCSSVIRPEHLSAALAFWQYAEDSVRFLFGEQLGDPLADAILSKLRVTPGGLSRTQLRDQFGRNRHGADFKAALRMLVNSGLITVRKEEKAGRGRPAEWLTAAPPTTKTTETTE
jgi:hypothetical protein